MNKIEAAERLAEAVEEFDSMETSVIEWSDVVAACKAYRSASVPSDEELGRVASKAWDDARSPDSQMRFSGWENVGVGMQRRWAAAASAVRQWVQRDGLTADEYRRRLDSWCESDGYDLTEDERTNLLVALGLIPKPEPSWEWDDANSMWTLGGKVNGEVFPCASVSLSEDGGVLGRVYFSDTKRDHCVVDSYKEACEWCEQQLREASE